MCKLFHRVIAVFFSVLWGFTASFCLSCAPSYQADGLFHYRDMQVTAKVRAECNGVSSEFRYSGTKDRCRVEFTAPRELTGYAIVLTENGGQITVDGLTAEAPAPLCTLPKIMRAAFTLSPESVSEIETAPHQGNEGETVTRVTADGVTVTLDKNGIPISAEGVLFGVKFNAEITEFTVNPQE